jgi:molybdopterin-guanine dinucleotide biosynthesis protein A
MGEDKGQVSFGRAPQVTVAIDLLDTVCTRSFVSVNKQQASQSPYAQMPTIVDSSPGLGPAQGLLSAWQEFPDVAWLLLAVDMPRVNLELLQLLIAQRNQDRIATALQHADGTIEPLCAIWEPSSRVRVAQQLDSGAGSLRQVLQQGNVELATLPEPQRLVSVNTPQERAQFEQERVVQVDSMGGK